MKSLIRLNFFNFPYKGSVLIEETIKVPGWREWTQKIIQITKGLTTEKRKGEGIM